MFAASTSSKTTSPTRHLKLGKWKDGGRAPTKMWRGAAVVDGNVAYFIDSSGVTSSYNSSTKNWSKLPECPFNRGSLAVIRGLLTAIGGVGPNNKLLSFMTDVGNKWVEHFPPMPTKRWGTAAVTTRQHLIVAGGMTGWSRLNTVEVMDIETLVWSTAANLPHPYSWASATICGDHLYMLGGLDNNGLTKSVLTCSLTKLLQSCSEASSASVWSRIADVPEYRSTCAAVNEELVAVGGQDEKYKATAAVYKYNPTTDSWEHISNMLTARYRCLVAALPTNEMIVIGGETKHNITNKVEVVNIHVLS